MTSIVYKGIDLVSKFKPSLHESQFAEGKLTLAEFTDSGNYLVRQIPMWKWEAGDPARANKELEPAKQFLVCRNARCKKRITDLTKNMDKQIIDGDWVIDYVEPVEEEDDDEVTEILSDEEEDENETPSASSSSSSSSSTSTNNALRYYDIHLTYDNMYNTPRVWFVGYDSNHRPLTLEQTFEDVSPEYAGTTVTAERHPHLDIQCVFVHPCKHSENMKEIISRLQMNAKTANDQNLNVQMYLAIFLNFISNVVPTIEITTITPTFD
mmetsp:Transcript_37918/g.62919  ORF Transcript_37918/g.62919 Transcript_37918/m.62919 type:complete len:267 (+) Transcript_37918:76-876(+)